MREEEYTIVVIDDEDLMRTCIQHVLEDAGYVVRVAASGEDGVRLVEEDARVRCVVSDFAMPGMNGWHVWCAVRELLRLRGGRFICCTGGPPACSPAIDEFNRLRRESDVVMVYKTGDVSALLAAVHRTAFGA